MSRKPVLIRPVGYELERVRNLVSALRRDRICNVVPIEEVKKLWSKN